MKRLLVAMDSDRRNGTAKVTGKFTGKAETIFDGLPKPKDWESFLRNDLPIITSIDAEVLHVAVENRLNKSQTKALAEMALLAKPLIEAKAKASQARKPADFVSANLPEQIDTRVELCFASDDGVRRAFHFGEHGASF